MPDSLVGYRDRGLPHALGPFLAIAVAQCAVGLCAFVLWGGWKNGLGEFSWQGLSVAVAVISFGWAGVSLLAGERRDLRASFLGAAFLFAASTFGLGLLGPDLQLNRAQMTLAESLRRLPVWCLLPYTLWRFAAVFPQAIDTPRMRNLLSLAKHGALIAGGLLLAANYVGAGAPSEGGATWFDALGDRKARSVLHVVVLSLSALALSVVGVRFRRAAQRDRLRARRLLMPLALVFGFAVLATLTIATESYLSETDRAALRGTVQSTFIFAGLCLVLLLPPLLAHAVVNGRVLEVRLFAPKALSLTIRRGLPSAGLALLVLIWTYLSLLLATELGAAPLLAQTGWAGGWASEVILGLFAVCLVATAVFFGRRSSRDSDAELNRSMLAPRLQDLRTIEVPFAWHTWIRDLAPMLGVEKATFVALDRQIPAEWHPSGCGSAESDPLRNLFGLRTEPLDVETANGRSELANLPTQARQWLSDYEAALLIPLFDSAGDVLAVMVVGERVNQQPLGEQNRIAASRISAAVALLLERKRLESENKGVPLAVEAGAGECLSCGRVFGDQVVNCADCDFVLVRIEEPLLIGGKFELQRCVGHGSLGKVYAARDRVLGRDVAVKVVPEGTQQGVRVLTREARAMAAFKHPKLATVYVAETFGRRLFVVTELLEGGTLAQRLAEEGSWPESRAIALGVELLEAIGPLHDRDLVHGDLKPSNIGFDRDRNLKILDFGMVRMLGDDPLPGTPEVESYRASTVLPGGNAGTPLYSPPEAWRGERVGTAADLWPVAVVLFELIAGVHPFEREAADSAEAASWTRAAILAGETRPIPSGRRVSTGMRKLLAKALDVEPGRRYVDAVSFELALREL